MLQITPLYAGMLTLILLWLSYRVVLTRRLYKVSVGDGGEREVTKSMRAQSNWVEYAPIGIVLLALIELQGFAWWIVHFLGLALLLGRAAHAWGFSRKPQIVILRQIGMYLTLGSLLLLAALNIWCAVFW